MFIRLAIKWETEYPFWWRALNSPCSLMSRDETRQYSRLSWKLICWSWNEAYARASLHLVNFFFELWSPLNCLAASQIRTYKLFIERCEEVAASLMNFRQKLIIPRKPCRFLIVCDFGKSRIAVIFSGKCSMPCSKTVWQKNLALVTPE